jgi:site-specific recombinase XerD
MTKPMKIEIMDDSQVQEAFTKAANEIAEADTPGRRKKAKRNYQILKTLANSGLRASELAHLRPCDIKAAKGYLAIRGKGKKHRNVDIPRELVISLQIFIADNRIKDTQEIFEVGRRQVYNISKRFSGCS